jgi:hypothetical protein
MTRGARAPKKVRILRLVTKLPARAPVRWCPNPGCANLYCAYNTVCPFCHTHTTIKLRGES